MLPQLYICVINTRTRSVPNQRFEEVLGLDSFLRFLCWLQHSVFYYENESDVMLLFQCQHLVEIETLSICSRRVQTAGAGMEQTRNASDPVEGNTTE